MDKEREEFELWCVKDDEFCIHRYDGSDEYSDDYTQCAWLAWQAAKAQAVPEGFVLVPIKPSEDFIDKLASVICDEFDTTISGSAHCASEAYKAMLAASQEQK